MISEQGIIYPADVNENILSTVLLCSLNWAPELREHSHCPYFSKSHPRPGEGMALLHPPAIQITWALRKQVVFILIQEGWKGRNSTFSLQKITPFKLRLIQRSFIKLYFKQFSNIEWQVTFWFFSHWSYYDLHSKYQSYWTHHFFLVIKKRKHTEKITTIRLILSKVTLSQAKHPAKTTLLPSEISK